jgi:glycosyltransferase involved in cell wall biosynthesis
MSIPVTVIIPTLNCKKKLLRHLDAIENWLPHVAEIIAVDSQSNDGTLELLNERLSPYNGKIISTCPGLYQAWNLAISKATQKYIYISTIGDIITKEGLNELYSGISSFHLDVLISPPRIVLEDGVSEANIKWPVHYIHPYIDFDNKTLRELDSRTLIEGVIFFLPATIIGSSASNIYRTEILQKKPFPIDCGTVGDSVWALKNLPYLKVGLSEKTYATFSWDGDRKCNWDNKSDISQMMQREAMNHHVNIKNINYRFVNEDIVQKNTYLYKSEVFPYFFDDYYRDECIRLQEAVNSYEHWIRLYTGPGYINIKNAFFTITSVRYWVSKIKLLFK